MSVRILIADDHGVLRAALRSLLGAEPDFQVVGEAADGTEALRLAQELQPDLLLLDINMPGPSGIEVTQTLRQTNSNIKILILTVHEDEGLLQEAIRVGASGYVVKRAVEAELMSSIRAVARGDLYIHPVMTRALIADLSRRRSRDLAPVESLTSRELEVLRLIAKGYTNREIAEVLVLSVRTVETHRANLMSKLHLGNRAELVQYAKEQGLL